MKQTHRIAGAVIVLFGMSIASIPYLSVKLVPEAQAFRGRGAAFVVGAAVGSSRSSAADANAAAAQQQAVWLSSRRPRLSSRQKSKRRRPRPPSSRPRPPSSRPRPPSSRLRPPSSNRRRPNSRPLLEAAGKSLPVGTVVPALPAGCTPKTVGGVAYHVCGNDFYRAAFQGSTLVYVTAQP